MIFVQNIDCGYSLEPPRRGDANLMSAKNLCLEQKRKSRYTTLERPSFTIYNAI